MENVKFNTMPESLDDSAPGPNILGPQRQAQRGVMGEVPPEFVGTGRKDEINADLSSKLTNSFLEQEVLSEKIQRDIDDVRRDKSIKDVGTPRDVLKTLIAAGEYKEDVELYNHTWTMKALSQGELIEAIRDMRDTSMISAGGLTEFVISRIVYSIEACDGKSIYDWFPDILRKQDYNSSEEFKLAARKVLKRYFDRMSQGVINDFDNAYNAIDKKRNEAIDQLKKS